jgi:hypothetical protein
MFPSPFPAHNMLLTCCWAMDKFTKENVSVSVFPAENILMIRTTRVSSL